ncbi:hypothetical protein R1T08_03430 [Streptomyces sp. SBC-4]|nr:hypothetical protein [Streptomyces sp. SBC-4]MDV5143373.1 hypothetical protein [Streptomyces sp. SBC-4]
MRTGWWQGVANALRVDNDRDGETESVWYRHTDGLLTHTWSDGLNLHSKDIGHGWNTHHGPVAGRRLRAVGDLTGDGKADIVTRDKILPL